MFCGFVSFFCLVVWCFFSWSFLQLFFLRSLEYVEVSSDDLGFKSASVFEAKDRNTKRLGVALAAGNPRIQDWSHHINIYQYVFTSSEKILWFKEALAVHEAEKGSQVSTERCGESCRPRLSALQAYALHLGPNTFADRTLTSRSVRAHVCRWSCLAKGGMLVIAFVALLAGEGQWCMVYQKKRNSLKQLELCTNRLTGLPPSNFSLRLHSIGADPSTPMPPIPLVPSTPELPGASSFLLLSDIDFMSCLEIPVGYINIHKRGDTKTQSAVIFMLLRRWQVQQFGMWTRRSKHFAQQQDAEVLKRKLSAHLSIIYLSIHIIILYYTVYLRTPNVWKFLPFGISAEFSDFALKNSFRRNSIIGDQFRRNCPRFRRNCPDSALVTNKHNPWTPYFGRIGNCRNGISAEVHKKDSPDI